MVTKEMFDDVTAFAKRLVEEEFKQRSIKNSLVPSGYHPATEEKELIDSATIKDLLAENDRHPEFTHREEHLVATKAQGDSEITRAYASTVELRTKSEHFKENNTFYRQWVLFRDFKSIAKDKKIRFEDSVDYAINFCDVSIRCSCPDFLYRGYSYMGDQLGYLYGLPREKRFPKKNNPNLRLSSCKHCDMALEHILKNKENIIKMFGHYYKRLEETPPDTMIAIPSSVVREKKEKTLDEFLEGFDEDGNELPVTEEQEPEEEKVEIISSTDPDTGVINVDTKLAEGGLPPEKQFKYGGEEDPPVDEDTVENVADDVSDEEVEEMATQIDKADTFSSYTPLHSNQASRIINKSAILSMGDTGSHSTENAILGAVLVFLERVVILIQDKVPSAWLFRDSAFSDTADGMVLNSKVTVNKDENSDSILELQFEIKDGILDHGFLVCRSKRSVLARIPTGSNGGSLTKEVANSLVLACLGG